MKFGIKNGFEIMKKGVDMDHEIYSTTPIQIEMRKYEKDVDTTFIENAGRGGHSIDVS